VRRHEWMALRDGFYVARWCGESYELCVVCGPPRVPFLRHCRTGFRAAAGMGAANGGRCWPGREFATCGTASAIAARSTAARVPHPRALAVRDAGAAGMDCPSAGPTAPRWVDGWVRASPRRAPLAAWFCHRHAPPARMGWQVCPVPYQVSRAVRPPEPGRRQRRALQNRGSGSPADHAIDGVGQPRLAPIR